MTKKKRSFNNLKSRTQKNYQNRNSYGNQKNYLSVPEGTTFFNPKKGTHKIDIIPYFVETEKHPDLKKGEDDYVLIVWVHKNIGVNRNRFICPAKTYDKPCPICEEYEELKNSGADKEIYDNLKPSQRAIYNIVDHSDNELKIFDASHFQFEAELLEESMQDETGELITFAHPEDGKTISFKDTEKWNDRFKKFRFLNRDESIEDDILDEALALDSLLVIYTYDELKEFFHNSKVQQNDDEEIEDDEPVKRKSKKIAKIEEDEDLEEDEIDDEEEDDDDEEDEIEEDEIEEDEIEEEPKKRKAKKVIKSKVIEEEDDDEEPVKRKSKKTRKKKDNECPKGHKIGIDYDDTDDCDNCDDTFWTLCATKHTDMEKEE